MEFSCVKSELTKCWIRSKFPKLKAENILPGQGYCIVQGAVKGGYVAQ
jgi:hypothetical protein